MTSCLHSVLQVLKEFFGCVQTANNTIQRPVQSILHRNIGIKLSNAYRHAYTCGTATSSFMHVSMCVCVFVCCVMYGLWKLPVGVRSRCQVAAGNMKVSQREGRGLVSKPDLHNQCCHKRANQDQKHGQHHKDIKR